MATTLIRGGTVVTATGRSEADVLVDGETIVAVLAPGSHLLGTDLTASVDTVIDATGTRMVEKIAISARLRPVRSPRSGHSMKYVFAPVP